MIYTLTTIATIAGATLVGIAGVTGRIPRPRRAARKPVLILDAAPPRARIIPTAIGGGFIVLIVIVAFWNATATAQAATIRGACGLHRGSALPVHPPLLPDRWHVRIGVRSGADGGTHMCRGHARRKTAAADTPNSIGSWIPFSLPRWNWSGILGTGAEAAGTGAACVSFGVAMVGELPTGLFDTAMTVATGAGCLAGWKDLTDHRRHDDPNVIFPIRPVTR